jgi:DNA-binding transcriptional regulator YiaG
MTKKYRSDAAAAIHETMQALNKVGAIDKQTMRRFDDACLTPVQPLWRNRSRLSGSVSTSARPCSRIISTSHPTW